MFLDASIVKSGCPPVRLSLSVRPSLRPSGVARPLVIVVVIIAAVKVVVNVVNIVIDAVITTVCVQDSYSLRTSLAHNAAIIITVSI